MSETKWTPGPWRVGTHHQILSTGDDNRCAGIASFNSWMGIEAAEANANLIAAAPDLYKALDDAPCRCSTGTFDKGFPKLEPKCSRCAALAKARGQAPKQLDAPEKTMLSGLKEQLPEKT